MSFLLREYVKLVYSQLRESSINASNLVWYHGSPYSGMKSISEFQGKIMFLTDSRKVANEYTKVLSSSGRKPGNIDVKDVPAVYELRLKFSDDKIFDTRKPEHLQLFHKLAKQSRLEDPEVGFTKNDISRSHALHGSKFGGDFPNYGIVLELIPRLAKEGFVASFIAEGSQGTSLAVWNPQENLELVGILQEAKRSRFAGSYPEESYEDSNVDNLMLNEPGTLVEPEVRRAIAKYLVQMGLMKSDTRCNPKGPKRKTRKA